MADYLPCLLLLEPLAGKVARELLPWYAQLQLPPALVLCTIVP